MEIIKEDKNIIEKIITALENGAVLVLPTDTVYGLVCDAYNKEAVKKIFKIKEREESKPLLVFVSNISQAKKIALVNEKQEVFLKNNWPEAVTVILPVKEKSLSPLVYKEGTIGIRVPSYNFLNLILEKFKNPLAQTSANVSDQPVLAKIKGIVEAFQSKKIQPDIIVDGGDLQKTKPSTIIDLTNNNIKVLR